MESAIPQLLGQADYLPTDDERIDFARDLISVAAAICLAQDMTKTGFLRACKVHWERIADLLKEVARCSSEN